MPEPLPEAAAATAVAAAALAATEEVAATARLQRLFSVKPPPKESRRCPLAAAETRQKQP